MTSNIKSFGDNNTIEKIYKQENLLDILIDFEEVLDAFDLYAFENWLEGEVFIGPELERYWVTVTLRYPYKEMPDPKGANRLLKHGARVEYEKKTENVPIDIRNIDRNDRQSSYEMDDQGEYKRKTEEQQYWYVTIKMPRRLLDDIETGSIVIDDEEDEFIDTEVVSQAEDEGLDDEQLEVEDQEDEQF